MVHDALVLGERILPCCLRDVETARGAEKTDSMRMSKLPREHGPHAVRMVSERLCQHVPQEFQHIRVLRPTLGHRFVLLCHYDVATEIDAPASTAHANHQERSRQMSRWVVQLPADKWQEAELRARQDRCRDEAISPHTARPETAQKRYPARTHRFGRKLQGQHADLPIRKGGYWSNRLRRARGCERVRLPPGRVLRSAGNCTVPYQTQKTCSWFS